MRVDPAYVLLLLAKLAPESPYKDTFEKTAVAIANRASASPLFGGDRGPHKTAAVIASVAFFESSLRPDAEGDCDASDRLPSGMCAKGARGHSVCLLQIHESNLKGLGTTRDQVLSDVDACVHAGLRMMHASFRICRARPLEERLSWFAAGSDGCTMGADPVRKSKHRILKALWLFGAVPTPDLPIADAIASPEPLLAPPPSSPPSKP